MTAKALGLRIAAWMLVCLLAMTALGAVIGVFVAFGVAMFGGVLGFALQQAAALFGYPVSWQQAGAVLGWSVLVLLAALVLSALVRAGLAFGRGQTAEALLRLSAVVHLVGASAAIALCMRSLETGWSG